MPVLLSALGSLAALYLSVLQHGSRRVHRSMMWLRQIAQLSTVISHAQSATAFHFFTSNRFFPSPPASPSALVFLTLEEAAGGSVISTSAMIRYFRFRRDEMSGLSWCNRLALSWARTKGVVRCVVGNRIFRQVFIFSSRIVKANEKG